MDEDFLDVTSSGNKKIFFIVILIVAMLLVFGYFFVFQKYYFEVKTVHLELGSQISTDVNDYLKKNVVDTSGYVLNTNLVNVNEVGEYKYSIKYNGRVKTGKFIVEDKTAPVYKLQDLVVEVGDEDFYIGDALSSCDDRSMPCVVSFAKEKDENIINTVGNYNVEIKIADVHGNSTKATAHVQVVEKGSIPDSMTDLNFASSSQELTNFNNDYYLKLDKPLNEETEEANAYIDEISTVDWEGYAKRVYPNYTFKDAAIVSIYNKNKYIIGYAVILTLNGTGGDTSVYVTTKVEG